MDVVPELPRSNCLKINISSGYSNKPTSPMQWHIGLLSVIC